ncbi:mitochondrial import protein Mmp37 [Pseudohyphozyma bogoriensis]|nr:mitochondrial import protein Mmp37 [Pseudohyphozyma bogoriensis]
MSVLRLQSTAFLRRTAAAVPLRACAVPPSATLRLRLLHSTPSTLLDTEQQPSSSSSSSSPPPFPNTRPPNPVPPPPISPPPVQARIPKRRITSVDQLPKTFGRNQIIPVPNEVQKDLEEVMGEFKAPVRYAFAYGSGVFRQSGYTDKDKPLLDFVFAVSHPSHWHAINMQQNPSHYSLPMRLLGSDAVAWMQDKGLGASVWFNVEVEVKGKIVKYGTISVEALCRDMLDWETLYISGRTQKPVKILVDDARVRLANQVNLASALRTALLLLPEEFTEVQLFEEIAGLSYRGDFRMAVGENPHKVRNIVGAQLEEFRSLYGGLLKSFWKGVYVIGEAPGRDGGRPVRLMRQDKSTKRRAEVLSKLPVGLKSKIRAHYDRKWNLKKALGAEEVGVKEGVEELEIYERIVEDSEFLMTLHRSIALIVGRPTFNQSLKGILSAGPLKSLRYIGPKLRKKWGTPAKPAIAAGPAKAESEPKKDEDRSSSSA